jgi:cytochrome oxidase Cu insertion factor (SCO1/SenC/PrrC family)
MVLLWAGYLAATAQEEHVSERAVAPPVRPRFPIAGVTARIRSALRPAALRAALRPAALRAAVARAMATAMASARSVTAFGALGVVLVGAAPMAVASADQNADPIIARAVAGASVPADRPAPDFELVSGSGRPVSLESLRGRVVLLTFLDPVCAQCRIIARELEMADGLLGPSGRDVELVAIAADSVHSGPVFIQAFNRRAGLTAAPNWLFLTGPPGPLQQVRTSYEKIAPHMMSGMTARGDIIFVIDKAGRIRQEIRDDPGPATRSTQSSFATLMRDAARHLLSS